MEKQPHIHKPDNFTSDIIANVHVRPIDSHEKSLWDNLMDKYHYLGLRTLPGESIRYVAEADGCWVALIGWTSGVFKCQPRDKYIGWSKVSQWQRLHLIANNARFLIFEGFHKPNLASRVLSLNLKRLSNDWEIIYGHPIYLVETFVDSSRFTGACYKAANFICLGATRGFGKSSKKYYHHGNPKMIFVRPLNSKALILLKSTESKPEFFKKVCAMAFTNKQTEELINALQKLPDPRHKRGQRHRLISIIATSICAVLCGARSFNAIAEWATHRTQNQLQRLWVLFDDKKKCYRPPSEPTIRRVLQSIDPDAVDKCICGWLQSVTDGDCIAIDGKTLKGARNGDGTKVQLLSAVLHQSGISIAQQPVSSKTNEIPVLREMLKNLDVEGKVITADALHTQRETAAFIVKEKKADYCFTVKDNQSSLKEDIAFLNLQKDFPPSARNY